jgi:hypothetical protein
VAGSKFLWIISNYSVQAERSWNESNATTWSDMAAADEVDSCKDQVTAAA